MGCRGGATGVGLTARTAASLCVFLTLVTASFLDCFGGALRLAAFATALATGFLLLTALEDVDFLTVLSFAGLRAADFAALARLALGFEVFAFTERFAVLAAARLPVERAVDRRRPFVRLLLMCGISKGCSLEMSSHQNGRSLA